MLDEAVVTANLPKMIIKDDTVVYNADAYRVPEGSVIEALVEALPGAKIDDDGKVSINGKNVKRFKMDGRDFMTGNNDAVMKNGRPGEGLRREERSEPLDGNRRRQRRLRAGVRHQAQCQKRLAG